MSDVAMVIVMHASTKSYVLSHEDTLLSDEQNIASPFLHAASQGHNLLPQLQQMLVSSLHVACFSPI